MKDVLLTSPEFIRLNSNISDNLNNKVLATAIREAQAIELQQLIGTNLLDKLKTIVDTEEYSLAENANYKSLLDYIQFYLSYTAIAKTVMLVNYKIDNVGVVTTRDENIDNISLDDAYSIQEYYQKKADHYAYLIQLFLLEHYADYPELTEPQIYKIRACLYSATNSNIWLGGVRGKGFWKQWPYRCQRGNNWP